MATDVNTKILRLKALIGDQQALAALNAAEEREVAAEALGVKSKEVDVTTKDEGEEGKALSLSALLDDIEAEIEDGLANGVIVDDVEPLTDEELQAEDEDDVEAKEFTDEDEELAFKELEALIIKIADARFKEHMVKLKELFVPRETERVSQIEELKAQLKETNDRSSQLQAALEELNGVQPVRTKGYRASADAATVVTDKSRVNGAAPSADPMDEFLKNFVMA